MADQLVVEVCPETGICSIVKETSKVDLMPSEVQDIRDAGTLDSVKAVIADSDAAFADQLNQDDLAFIEHKLR